MKMKQFLSRILCLAITLSMVLGVAPTVSADYSGVDYSRFHYGTNGLADHRRYQLQRQPALHQQF